MALWEARALAVSVAILLGGCSFSDDVLWPSLTGEDPSGASETQMADTQAQTVAPASAPQPGYTPSPAPALGTMTYEPVQVAQASPTGTFVGQKIAELRGQLINLQNVIGGHSSQLQQLRGASSQNAERYHGLVAAINARLQVGSTPGNPVLVSQWNEAQGQLDRISVDIGRMNSLANEIASDSSMAAFVLESTRAAYGIAGAVEQDHTQLAVLEDEVNRTVVSIDRLLNELSEDISRQSTYTGRERGNLTALSLAVKNGELCGSSLANRAFASAAPAPSAAPGGSVASVTGRRPLVVIRFDDPNVQYEQALYSAMSRALERRPDAVFDLVAVASTQGSSAQVALNTTNSKRNAEQVLRSLTGMGLPANRITLSAMSSPTAESNEVHIYVR